MSILLGILTFVLILVSLFLVLIVLMQKSKDGGMGAALGGGASEAAFGADTTNVLSQATKYSAILFFVLTFALYLGRIYEHKHAKAADGSALPAIAVPATPVTSTPAPAPAPVVGLPPPVTVTTAQEPTAPAPVSPAPTPAPEAPKK